MQLTQLFLAPLLIPVLSAPGAFAAAPPAASGCDCSHTNNGGPNSKDYICRDFRLGPKKLPSKLPLTGVLSSYDRFGGDTPGEFLQKWTDDKGNFQYPPQNGFQLDLNGNAINGSMVLRPGTLVDRFGSEYGAFISAADAPYSQRALPPSNLNTNAQSPDYPYNYHVYRVVKPLTVVGGPIAPWFGQPGLGAQFFIGNVGNVMTLINQGFLQRVEPDVLIAGKKKGCIG